jgi:hypothetical protein
MTATAVGLWLAGIGSVVAVLAGLIDPPSRGTGGMVFGSPASARPDRVRFAIRTVGLGYIALGSTVVAVAELPPWWFAVATLGALAGAVWLLGAWSQHRVWSTRRIDARRQAAVEGDNPHVAWAARCAEHCGRWRWALLHPLDGEVWPGSFTRGDPHPEPTESA